MGFYFDHSLAVLIAKVVQRKTFDRRSVRLELMFSLIQRKSAKIPPSRELIFIAKVGKRVMVIMGVTSDHHR